MSKIELIHGDCLVEMKKIQDGSVDMVLCDPPYGILSKSWDTPLDWKSLFEAYNRVLKENGVILLFSQMPMSADLVYANRKHFRYEIIWDKVMKRGFLNARKMPMRRHENILVFYRRLPTYNPQMENGVMKCINNHGPNITGCYRSFGNNTPHFSDQRYPSDIVRFSATHPYKRHHPTDKPVPLLEYLIRTYTNEGETVLDNCMGSGSTGVACVNTGRNFIGIEKDKHYFDIATARIATAEQEADK